MPSYFSIALGVLAILATAYIIAAWQLHHRARQVRGPRERLHPGMEVHFPAWGETLVYTCTRDQSGGERFSADWSMDAFSSGPRTCVHPRARIHIQIHQGCLTMVIRGKKHRLQAGESVEIQKGTPYRYFNADTTAIEAAITATPASAMDMFLVQIDRSGLGHERLPGFRMYLQGLCLSTTYDCTYYASLPVPLQRVITILLGPFIRLLGIRSYYAE